MRRSTFFVGAFVVLLGAVLLAINLGVVTSKVWTYFWPLVLVLLGVWFIVGTYMKKDKLESVERSIALAGDREAEIEFNYGAGILSVGPSNKPQELVGGMFVGGLTDEVDRSADKTFIKLSTPADLIFPTSWVHNSEGLGWNVGITKDLPLKLHFHTGACEARLDLRELRVSDLIVETGASKTVVDLPQNAGFTRVEIKSGAAEVRMTVPQGVGAIIKESSGLSGINVDTTRFIQNGHEYKSADFETAANKIEINYEGGVGSVDIR